VRAAFFAQSPAIPGGRLECREDGGSVQLAHAVPRFLTLYMACMPCTAWTSHAAWDIDTFATSSCISGRADFQVTAGKWLRGLVRTRVVAYDMRRCRFPVVIDHLVASSAECRWGLSSQGRERERAIGLGRYSCPCAKKRSGGVIRAATWLHCRGSVCRRLPS
jgi:hypothetical protein